MSRPVPPASIGSLLDATTPAGARPRFVFPDARCTSEEMRNRADAYAAALRAQGVASGERVGLWLPPGPELVAALFGVARAGMIAVPVSDRFRPVELAHVVQLARPAAVVTTAADPRLDRLAIVDAAMCRERLTGAGDDADPQIVLAEDIAAEGCSPSPSPSPSPDDIAMLLCTSGTSAAPKVCKLTHRGLLANARSLAAERYLMTDASVVWSPLPLFHIAGVVSMLAAVTAGATFVHSGLATVAKTVEMLEANAVTHALAAFETIWLQLLDEAATRQVDLSTVHVALSSNGEQQLRKLQGRLSGAAFVANYGSTEAGGHLSMGRADEPVEVRVRGGGLPLPGNEVRICAAGTDDPVPAGELGELQFRGVSRFAGYLDDPQADAAAFAPGGWFRSGDLARLDKAGRLYFMGRLKDMLKVGGENVSALEVESYLVSHPAVNVAAVVGAADAYYGEVPAAFVQLAPGSTVTADELIGYCLGNIATYKVPRYVRFVDEWPMSGTKIRKGELHAVLAAELTSAGVTSAPRLDSGIRRR